MRIGNHSRQKANSHVRRCQVKLESYYRCGGVQPHPIYAMTIAGEEVECVAWDDDAECWLSEDGRRFDPTDLACVSPPFDECDTYYALEVPLRAISIDGEEVRIVGWVACRECWETDICQQHLLIHAPVPEITSKYRSLDAIWRS